MTKVAKREQGTILRHEQLSREQVELIKSTIAKEASDDELKLFLTVCNRTGLDPFTHQIWAIKRTTGTGPQAKTTLVYQIGIDGFRLIAQRSKAKGGPVYAGQTQPQWCDEDGIWTTPGEIWTSTKPPFAAKVGVYVEGFVEPIFAPVEYRRVVQTRSDGQPNIFWAKGAAFQLAKCAEAAALRKALPNDLSGLYLEEEMGAGEEPPEITEPRSLKQAKDPQEAVDMPMHPPASDTDTEKQDAPAPPQEPAEPGPTTTDAPTPTTHTEEPASEMLVKQVNALLLKHEADTPKDLTALEARMILSKQSKKALHDVLERIEKARTGMF